MQAAFILQLEASLGGAILNSAKDLYEKARVFDDATASANLLILNVQVAVLALVLNLNELDVSHKTQHFYDVTNYLICWNRFDKLNLIFCLEVSHLVFNLADDFEV